MPESSVILDDVHGAPIGKPWDRESRNIRESRLIIQRKSQLLSNLRHERRALLGRLRKLSQLRLPLIQLSRGQCRRGKIAKRARHPLLSFSERVRRPVIENDHPIESTMNSKWNGENRPDLLRPI